MMMFGDYFFFISILYGLDLDFIYFEFGSFCGSSIDGFIFDCFDFIVQFEGFFYSFLFFLNGDGDGDDGDVCFQEFFLYDIFDMFW